MSEDEELQADLHFPKRHEELDEGRAPEDAPVHTPIPRRMRIQQKDLEVTGYTIGCPGFHAQMVGAAPRNHDGSAGRE